MIDYLVVFFVSMVPLIELRGAIPISQIRHLPIIQSYIIAIIGNMLPVASSAGASRKGRKAVRSCSRKRAEVCS